MYSFLRTLGLVGLTLSLTACGPKLVEVSGKVTYNHEPLNKPEGQIVFVGPNNEQAMAPIQTDGSYKAAQVVSGPNRVAISYANPAAKGGRFAMKGKTPGSSPPAFLTPAKFAAVDTSGITADIKPGEPFNYDMTGPTIP